MDQFAGIAWKVESKVFGKQNPLFLWGERRNNRYEKAWILLLWQVGGFPEKGENQREASDTRVVCLLGSNATCTSLASHGLKTMLP